MYVYGVSITHPIPLSLLAPLISPCAWASQKIVGMGDVALALQRTGIPENKMTPTPWLCMYKHTMYIVLTYMHTYIHSYLHDIASARPPWLKDGLDFR